MRIEVYSDASVLPMYDNHATFGYAIDAPTQRIRESGRIGYGITINQAEFLGAVKALQHVENIFGLTHAVVLYMDSQLVIKCVTNQWQIRVDALKDLNNELKLVSKRFTYFQATWIPRNKNRLADNLAKKEQDKWTQVS